MYRDCVARLGVLLSKSHGCMLSFDIWCTVQSKTSLHRVMGSNRLSEGRGHGKSSTDCSITGGRACLLSGRRQGAVTRGNCGAVWSRQGTRPWDAYAELHKRKACQDRLLDRKRRRVARRMARQIWQQVHPLLIPCSAMLDSHHSFSPMAPAQVSSS